MGKIAEVIRFLIFLFLGHAIMLALGDKGIHPDRFIADLIDAAMSPNMSYSINLIIVCVFALIMTVVWESTNISQRFAYLWDVLTKRAAPEHAPLAEAAPAIGKSDPAEISTSHQDRPRRRGKGCRRSGSLYKISITTTTPLPRGLATGTSYGLC